MVKIEQGIKYESERDPDFATSLLSKRGCENLLACIQCGTCSGVCPLSHYMDYTPRRVIHLSREGFHEDVLQSLTIWLCSSCYSCTVECPRKIHITDVMYALKRDAIEHGYYPKRFPIPVLANEFFKMVVSRGRTNETQLAMRMFLRSNWWELFRGWKLGLKLLLRGRLGLFEHKKIRHQQDLAEMLKDS